MAAQLLERHVSSVARAGRPSWFELEWTADSWRSQAVTHPEGLFGHRVADRADAVAVVATGRLRLLDPAHEPPADLRSGFAGGLTMACVMDRRGDLGSDIHLPDGKEIETPPQSGLMLDTLRRSLGLSTAPPPESVVRVHLLHWMEAVLHRAPATRRLNWKGVLACYPWLVGFSFADPDEAELVIEAMVRVHDWPSLRSRVAAGVDSCEDLSAVDADWMDDGMFARWILAAVPPMEPLIARVARLATPAAAARLREFTRTLIDEAESSRPA